MNAGESTDVAARLARPPSSRELAVVACLFSHTDYSLWGLHLVERALRILWGDYCSIHCHDIAGLREGWESRGARPVLIGSDAPKQELLRLLSAANICCFVFVDEPIRLIEQAMYSHGVPPMDALRGCTHFFTSFAQAVSINSALSFRCDDADQSAESVTRRVLAAVWDEGASVNFEDVVAAVLAETPAAPTRPLESDLLSVALRPGANPRVFPTPRDQEVIASVVDAYRALYRPDGMSSVTWPPELFFTSNPGEGRQKEILLAGDARVLIRGPYCALPAGNWRLAVEFEVVDHVSGDSVEADVVCGYGAETLARGLFVLPERGIFRYSLDFVLDEPKSGFETRLRMLKSAIRGVLCLRKVTATRPDAAEERRAQTAGADDANIYNADDDGSVVRAPLSER